MSFGLATLNVNGAVVEFDGAGGFNVLSSEMSSVDFEESIDNFYGWVCGGFTVNLDGWGVFFLVSLIDPEFIIIDLDISVDLNIVEFIRREVNEFYHLGIL